MKFRISRDISTRRSGLGSGGGGGPTAPVVVTSGSIEEQPIVGTAILLTEPDVTGEDSVAYQWYRGVPTTTAIGGATSAGYTPVDADYATTLYRRATYTNAQGDTVNDIAAPGVVGKQFSEDFSGFLVSDNTTAILAANWTRSASGIEGLISSESQAPTSGKALEFWGTVSSYRSLYRNNWDTFSNTNSADDYEDLILYKHQTASGRFSFRPHNGGLTDINIHGAGFVVRLGVLFACMPGEDSNDPAASGSTNLGSLTVGTYYWFRKRSIGNTAYFRKWVLGTPEPTVWDATRVHGSALANRGPSIAYRAGTASDIQRVLFISSGHRVAAPWPVGYDVPIGASADAMTYAAATTRTSFAQEDALVTYNFSSASVGTYCTGDPFLINSAGATFTSITPASQDVSGRQINGAMVDYGEGAGSLGPAFQGFDGFVPGSGQYVPYDASLNVDPGKTGSSLVFASGVEGSILKAVSKTTPTATAGRDRLEYVGAFTVVATAPPTNAFRPPISAPSKVSSWVEDDINWSYVRDLAMPSSAPSVTGVINGQRWPLQTWTTYNDSGRTIRGNTNHNDYGPNIIMDGASALLRAQDDTDLAAQRQIIVALVQRGIDVYGRAVEGGDWNREGGGTGNGRKFFLAVAARLLDDAGMAAYLDQTPSTIWTEDNQHRYVTASDVTNYDYEALDEGMPEWMSNPYTSTPSRAEAATYRAINTMWQPGAALALQLIGARTIWANEAFFDYCDRIMARTFFDGSGTSNWALSLSGTNSPPTFHRDMWANHRSAAGMPAIWNW